MPVLTAACRAVVVTAVPAEDKKPQTPFNGVDRKGWKIKGDETLTRIGGVHGKTAAQIGLRWLVQQDVPAIPRTSKLERLSENIDIFDFELSDDEMAQISRMGNARTRLTDFGFAPKWD